MSSEKIKILLVDDDEDDRDFFNAALNSIHVLTELTSMFNGEQAINYFKIKKPLPDFIFLDINMPKTDGIECLKYIKANVFTKNLPVIMLSTASSAKTIELTQQNGAAAYIEKPYSIKELSLYINYCLHNLNGACGGTDFLLNNELKKV